MMPDVRTPSSADILNRLKRKFSKWASNTFPKETAATPSIKANTGQCHPAWATSALRLRKRVGIEPRERFVSPESDKLGEGHRLTPQRVDKERS